MIGRPIELRQYDFSGGVNLADDPAHIGKDQLADLRNWTVDETGILTKRLGSVLVGESVGAPKAMFRAKLGSTFYLLAYVGGTLYRVNETTGQFTQVDYGFAGNHMGFALYQGRLYYAAKSVIKFWDGVIANALTGQSDLTWLCVHNDRLWASDGVSELYYTDLQKANDALTGEQPPADNMMPVADRTGQVMNGLVSQNGELLIMMSNSMHCLYGYTDEEFTRKQEIAGLGCLAPRSLACGDGLVFFVSTYDVNWVRGGTVQSIGEPIKPLLKRLSLTRLASAAAAFHDHKYYLSIPAASAGDDTLLCVFDVNASYRAKAPIWEVHTLGGYALAACDLEGDSGKLYALAPAGSYSKVFSIMADSVYSDAGQDIEAYAESRWLLQNQTEWWMEFRELFIAADFPTGGTMTVTWTTKQGGTTATGTITATCAGRWSLPITARGTDVKLKFTVKDAKPGWKLRGFTLTAHPRWVYR